MTEHEIECVARAICASYGDDYDEQPPDLPTLREWRAREGGIVRAHDPGLPTQADWNDMARAAIEALDAARTENGLVTVPREPTEEMWVAEREAVDVGVSPWRAMLDVLLGPAPKTVTIPHEGVVHD